jgi:HK97 family phage portal protein
MFGLFNFGKKSTASNSAANLAVLESFSNLLRLSKNYNDLAKTGYSENVIVNTCIHRTAAAINDIPHKYLLDGEEIDRSTNNPLVRSIINAIDNPNSDMSKDLFTESVLSSSMIAGEYYIFPSENAAGRVSELQYLRPDKISKTQSDDERVHQYEYNSGTRRYIFNREYSKIQTSANSSQITIENPDTLEGCFNFIAFRNYNPLSEINGLSPLNAAGLSVDGHNTALEWNNSIMQNSGKPSGILSFPSPSDGDSLSALEKKMSEKTTGKNRGRILVAGGAAKFDKFSMTSQEMDFINGIVQRATDICNALDYPPFLLGFVGSTFNNQAEAKLSLYENSAIPKFKAIWGSLAAFLSKKYDINFEIKPDLKNVVALAPRFEQMNKNLLEQWRLNVIDQNEIRSELGYEEKQGGTDIYYDDFRRVQNNSNIPEA